MLPEPESLPPAEWPKYEPFLTLGEIEAEKEILDARRKAYLDNPENFSLAEIKKLTVDELAFADKLRDGTIALLNTINNQN